MRDRNLQWDHGFPLQLLLSEVELMLNTYSVHKSQSGQSHNDITFGFWLHLVGTYHNEPWPRLSLLKRWNVCGWPQLNPCCQWSFKLSRFSVFEYFLMSFISLYFDLGSFWWCLQQTWNFRWSQISKKILILFRLVGIARSIYVAVCIFFFLYSIVFLWLENLSEQDWLRKRTTGSRTISLWETY